MEWYITYSRKVWWKESLVNRLFSSIWRKIVRRINRSTNRLLIVSTKLDDFSLPNHRQFAKFTQLSPTKLSHYTVVSYHALLFELLLIDMHHNYTRTDFEVCACTASSPHVRKKNSFHKLIRVIRIFTRKSFVAQCDS